MRTLGLKKNLSNWSAEQRREAVDPDDPELSIRQQCEVLGVNRSSFYYDPHPRLYHLPEFREAVMARLDYWSCEQPAWGVNKLVPLLQGEGLSVSRELVRELRGVMGLQTIYPHRNVSKADHNARKVPYLIGSLRRQNKIWLPNLVWSIDITYIKMYRAHMYLTAIIDWYSKYIVGWELSDTLDTAPTVDAAKAAFRQYGEPAYFNSDQGSQFTSLEYKSCLCERRIKQSMDGKGRWADNIAIERWFRTLKVENIYINEYTTPRSLRSGIARYVETYNTVRPHEDLKYMTPSQVYHGAFKVVTAC